MSGAAIAHPLTQDPGFASLKQLLISSTGLAYYADKDHDLAFRISARLAHLQLRGCDAYLALLKDRHGGESERHLLIGQLTIGETFFFRHSEQFDAVRDVVLPDLIKRNQATRTLRIWSAGCAIGAEPYSLAILLKRHFAAQLAGWDIQILGTDINQGFLATAARGAFDERALRSTPDELRQKWFSQTGASWTLVPHVRESVSFQYHNLVEHPYPSIVHGIVALDLILCRNVMIYFDWATIQLILDRFHDCLVDGGWLAVGHAESNPEVFRAYRTVGVPGATLYQKTGEPEAASYRPSPVVPDVPWQPSPGPPPPWSPPVLPTLPDRVPSAAGAIAAAPLTGLALVRRLADEGKWLDAARACEPLLERDRLDPTVHFYQALIMEQRSQAADAERALRRAIYLDRRFTFAHYHLALLLEKTGHRDAAIQSLNNVREMLSGLSLSHLIAEADGLTAEELGQLTDMHLELWRT